MSIDDDYIREVTSIMSKILKRVIVLKCYNIMFSQTSSLKMLSFSLIIFFNLIFS